MSGRPGARCQGLSATTTRSTVSPAPRIPRIPRYPWYSAVFRSIPRLPWSSVVLRAHSEESSTMRAHHGTCPSARRHRAPRVEPIFPTRPRCWRCRRPSRMVEFEQLPATRPRRRTDDAGPASARAERSERCSPVRSWAWMDPRFSPQVYILQHDEAQSKLLVARGRGRVQPHFVTLLPSTRNSATGRGGAVCVRICTYAKLSSPPRRPRRRPPAR